MINCPQCQCEVDKLYYNPIKTATDMLCKKCYAKYVICGDKVKKVKK